jgi:hypothetical protein
MGRSEEMMAGGFLAGKANVNGAPRAHFSA